ncbi:hypothetical protein Q8F57_030730 [Paraburkholderia terrae]|uniref:hypothetical protein n=1 Tax=Paraburkholderia terrae TaxID=311230 RepID=UPI00296B09E4|nr:hypothetical protein [Paraburkholderia terrae]MDW3655660.1 hypothetical protein [Paraburkholderia terrae]
MLVGRKLDGGLVIEISGQYGDPQCAPLFFPLQRELNDLFKKYCVDDYFVSLEKISIIFRISGEITDFEGDGPERFKFIRKGSEFTIDFVVPKFKWMGKSEIELRLLINDGLIKCFNIFIDRSISFNEMNDKDDLLRDVGLVLRDFVQLN